MTKRDHLTRFERTKKAARCRQQFLTLMELSPRTVAELATRAGCPETFVRNELIRFKEQGICHLHSYIKCGINFGFTAQFAYGPGKDAKLPKAAEEPTRQSAARAREMEAQGRAIELAKLRQQVATKVKCYGIWGLA